MQNNGVMTSPTQFDLSAPAIYLPFISGKYEVAPGLRVFGSDQKNPTADKNVFQIDKDYFHYRAQKLKSRAEGLGRYYPENFKTGDDVLAPVLEFIVDKLASEHPGFFQKRTSNDSIQLHCILTNETLVFDRNFKLVSNATVSEIVFRDAFDALAMQVQEDMAIWRQEGEDEWLGVIHLKFPNHWDPQEKIGRSFMAVHQPVAHFDKLSKIAPKLVDGMIQRGPFVRFAWGIATDKELNHHPEKKGRAFNPLAPELFVRVERQTLHPFPTVGAALFTIRTYFEDCKGWNDQGPLRSALIQAIKGMSSEALAYKGLRQSKQEILNWLISI